MAHEYNRSLHFLTDFSNIRGAQTYPLISLSSRSSTKLLSRLLARSTMSDVELPKAALALYPKVITRAVGRSCGRKSCSQNAFVRSLVQVFFGSPLRPCTATTLLDVSMSPCLCVCIKETIWANWERILYPQSFNQLRFTGGIKDLQPHYCGVWIHWYLK